MSQPQLAIPLPQELGPSSTRGRELKTRDSQMCCSGVPAQGIILMCARERGGYGRIEYAFAVTALTGVLAGLPSGNRTDQAKAPAPCTMFWRRRALGQRPSRQRGRAPCISLESNIHA